MIECLTLAQAQLGEELTSDDARSFTIKTDGTTKHGQHYGTNDILIFEESYVHTWPLSCAFRSCSGYIGYINFKEILEDLETVYREPDTYIRNYKLYSIKCFQNIMLIFCLMLITICCLV